MWLLSTGIPLLLAAFCYFAMSRDRGTAMNSPLTTFIVRIVAAFIVFVLAGFVVAVVHVVL